MKTRTAKLAVIGLLAAMGLVAGACVPPPPPAPKNWSLKATSITSNDSQDEVRIFGACVAIPNCDDEAYLIHIGFKVTIGQANSAETWVVNGDKINGLSEGSTRVLSGGQQAPITFKNIQPLDVLDVFNPNSKLTVFGTYIWAAEEDTINSLSTGANGLANTFKSVLNNLLATATLPSSEQAIIDLVLNALFSNIGSLFKIIVSNIPCAGLCDDVLGGAVYVGIGAGGTLGTTLNSLLTGVTVPNINIPLVDVPPDVLGGGIFTLTGTKNYTQTFTGADGQHTYSFQTGPA
ncbi:MAG: hypothetical protein FJW94_08410 [Actinobacteria bacterium]|nr:hypothetical protein [Actinomycetota bacterium]